MKSRFLFLALAVLCAGCAPALKDLKPALSEKDLKPALSDTDSGSVWFATAPGALSATPTGQAS